MYINKIILINFRNYKKIEIDLSAGINVFVGSNAQGKTNLLEAIHYLSSFVSYRTSTDRDLVSWGENFFYIKGVVNEKGYYNNIEVVYTSENAKKQVKINGKNIERLHSGIGKVNSVIFAPEDIYLVKGSPAVRRDFLDKEIVQISNIYGQYLRNYYKILRYRNNILKEMRKNKEKNIEQINVWNRQLVEKGSYIIVKRVKIIKKISLLARLQHRQLTDGKEDLGLKYKKSVNIDEKFSLEEIKDFFIKELEKILDKEIYAGKTLLGPHRDDLEILINGKSAKGYASQGQQRTVVLALKLSELELIKGEKGSYPLLLLDDVFSELDKERREGLLSLINEKVQTLITATNISFLEGLVLNKIDVYNVEKGKLKKCKNQEKH